MKTPKKGFLFWTPRILGLVFAALLSLFALDVFEENHGFWNPAIALLMHLIPTAILLLILALSWRWEWVGGVIFPVLGACYLFCFWGRFHWSAYAIISGSLFILGTLFRLGWSSRVRLRASI